MWQKIVTKSQEELWTSCDPGVGVSIDIFDEGSSRYGPRCSAPFSSNCVILYYRWWKVHTYTHTFPRLPCSWGSKYELGPACQRYSHEIWGVWYGFCFTSAAFAAKQNGLGVGFFHSQNIRSPRIHSFTTWESRARAWGIPFAGAACSISGMFLELVAVVMAPECDSGNMVLEPEISFSFFFFHITYLFYTHQCIHVNPNLPIYPTTTPTPCHFPPLVAIHLFSTSVSLFLPCKPVICTIFLDSTYMR